MAAALRTHPRLFRDRHLSGGSPVPPLTNQAGKGSEHKQLIAAKEKQIKPTKTYAYGSTNLEF